MTPTTLPGSRPTDATPAAADLTLSDLVRADPSRATILEHYDLHYCCDGDSTLAEAAANAGVDLTELRSALNLTDASRPIRPVLAPDLVELTRSLVDRHHAALWRDLLRVQDLVDHVARVHGWRHPELRRLRELFGAVVADLGPHLIREERIVYPAIAQLAATRRPVESPEGTVTQLVDELTAEHDVIGALFNEMHRISGGFASPVDACSTYREMNEALLGMEARLHQQLHQENNVLFPAARALAAEVGD